MLTEEALSERTTAILQAYIAAQPTWSDLPFVVLVGEAWQGLKALGEGNVAVLGRPTRSATLLTVMRSALRARARQYQVRELLERQAGINETLERRVAERTAELQSAYAQTEAERQRISHVLEAITDAFIALDEDFRVIYLNSKGTEVIGQLTGKSAAEVIGKKLPEAVPPLDQSPFGEAYRQVMHRQTAVHLEAFFLPLEAWFELHAYPSTEGLSLYFHDVSERKEIEQALRDSEERFTQAVQVGPMAASITTLEEGRFLDINKSFEQLTGYRRAEVVGRANHELELWASHEDQAKIKAGIKEGGYHQLDLQIRTKAGKVRDILASAEVMEIAGTAGLLQMFYDITDQKRSEEELMEAIQVVMQDTAWFSRSVVERLAQVRERRAGRAVRQAEVAELTAREQQVLECVSRGQDNRQIATDLGLKEQTIRNYITRIYEKLGVHSRAEAVVWARERGLGR